MVNVPATGTIRLPRSTLFIISVVRPQFLLSIYMRMIMIATMMMLMIFAHDEDDIYIIAMMMMTMMNKTPMERGKGAHGENSLNVNFEFIFRKTA